MSRKAEVAAMRAAAKDLDAMIAEWGASADELMEECREIRRRSRGKKRDANRALVLDANMLIRAFLGKRVRRDMAGVAAKRGGDVDQAHWGPS